MKKKKFIGINTDLQFLNYDGFDEYKLRDSISLLDYDAAIINTDYLIDQYGSQENYKGKRLLTDYASNQIKEHFSVLKEQLIEMLKQGRNIFIIVGHNENCYIYTGATAFSGTGKNARRTDYVDAFNMYSFLPIDISVTHIYGDKVDIICKSPYVEFFKKAKECYQYAACINVKDGIDLLRVKGSSKVVSSVVTYGKGRIIFLPLNYSKGNYTNKNEWNKNSRTYLDAIFELNEKLSANSDEYILPDWAEEFFILNEADENEKLKKVEQKVDKLLQQIEEQKQRIKLIQRYKTIITSSGVQLEEIVKDVLSELGISLIEAEPGRSDIIAKFKEMYIVAEIKGVTKSAAEKHAAQLEKWVAQFMEENDRQPKPLLIVNGFCDTPLLSRTEEVFPNQMLKYSLARGHALIDTSQLLCLFIEIKNNPTLLDERISELLSTVGVYKRYENLKEFLIYRE